MRIVSTNIAKPTTFLWDGKEEITGIHKKPTYEPVYLGKEEVKGDEISDRENHGGFYKACYLFSADHYNYWKNLYPNLDWTYGMLGENLTVEGMDDSKIYIGDIFKIGEALVQVTHPREPCYKFGVKFGTQAVLKQFIQHGFPGTYVSILEEGLVETGDEMVLTKSAKNSLSVTDFFELLYAKEKNQNHLKLAIQNEVLPESKREKFKTYLL